MNSRLRRGTIRRKRRRERGTAFVEFSLVVLPLFACVLMTLDVAWIFFAWACIQEGAREGVRFAVTEQLLSGYSGQDASIRAVIENYSVGFVNSSNASSVVNIQYYLPTTMTAVSGTGSNASGNVIRITVGPITVGTFGPLFRNWSPISLKASSSDVMGGAPGSTPPSR